MCLISVIIPCYNAELYISRCLDSLKKQIIEDFEVIIIDDGSNDKTYYVVDNYIKYNKLSWKLLSKANGGVSSARNLGIKNTNSKYIAFIDADDYVEPNFLQKLLIASENNVMPFANFNRFTKGKKKMNVRKISCGLCSYAKVIDWIMEGRLFGSVWGCLFRTDVIIEQKLQFEPIHFCEDILFLVNYIMISTPMCNILNDNVYNYCDNEGSASSNQYSIKYVHGYEKLPNKFAEIFKVNNRLTFHYKRKINKEYAISVLRLYRCLEYDNFVATIKDKEYRKNCSVGAIPKGEFKFIIIYYLFYFRLYRLLKFIGKR